jgi:hypothetical protein
MKPTWFKPRGYMHFDAPVGLAFALGVADPARLSKHAWSLIHYVRASAGVCEDRPRVKTLLKGTFRRMKSCQDETLDRGAIRSYASTQEQTHEQPYAASSSC